MKEEKILSLTRNRRGLTSLTPPLLTQDTKRHSGYSGRQGHMEGGGVCFELAPPSHSLHC